MVLYPSNIVLDVSDMKRATRFWSGALSYVVAYESPTYVALKHPKDAARFRIGFQPADGANPGVNALHLDLATDDMQREAKRLEGLGATRVKDWPYPKEGASWIVMRDPDGHEFCVVEQPDDLVYRD